MRVVLENHGCRANQADGDGLRGRLSSLGYVFAPEQESAEVAIVNGCAITHRAVSDARAAIRSHRRRGRRVIVTGCVANAEAEALAKLEGVELVLGTEHRDDFAARFDQQVRGERPATPLIAAASLVRQRPEAVGEFALPSDRARAFLKIQDGCNYRCAFCIVPQVRGRSRSVPLEEVGDRLDVAIAAGVREVVLTGIHIGTWGWDLGIRPGLVHLLRDLLPRLGDTRVRLGTLDPQEASVELLELIATDLRICPQLHLGLQSGSDRILRRMRRGHTVKDLRPALERLRVRRPEVAVTGDIIAGFPSEQDEDFEASLSMLDALEMEDAHVFGFSVRGGTEAESMEGQLPPPIIRARVRRLRDAASARWERAWAARVGHTIDVATFRSASAPGVIDAHAGQGSRVRVSHQRSEAPTRTALRVRVTGTEDRVVCAVEDLTP